MHVGWDTNCECMDSEGGMLSVRACGGGMISVRVWIVRVECCLCVHMEVG